MALIGEVARKRYQFTAENISHVAYALGDTNPAHHDPVMAAGTRFGENFLIEDLLFLLQDAGAEQQSHGSSVTRVSHLTY